MLFKIVSFWTNDVISAQIQSNFCRKVALFGVLAKLIIIGKANKMKFNEVKQ